MGQLLSPGLVRKLRQEKEDRLHGAHGVEMGYSESAMSGHTGCKLGKRAGDLHQAGQSKFSEVSRRAKGLSLHGERTDSVLKGSFRLACATKSGKTEGSVEMREEDSSRVYMGGGMWGHAASGGHGGVKNDDAARQWWHPP